MVLEGPSWTCYTLAADRREVCAERWIVRVALRRGLGGPRLRAVKMRNPIIVALDVPTPGQALELVWQLGDKVGAYKIGSELFTSAGPDFVRKIAAANASVFLDLKFHDIPNTVAKAVASATRLGVRMITVHTFGGLEMMQAAERAAQETAKAEGFKEPPLVLGVTVLTSMNATALGDLGLQTQVGQQVERLASLAVKAGLRGLVCSPLEVVALRQFLPAHMKLVTPGIRGPGDKTDDQKRTLSAREAIDAGADWLVIGRPIYSSQDPRKAAEDILGSLQGPQTTSRG